MLLYFLILLFGLIIAIEESGILWWILGGLLLIGVIRGLFSSSDYDDY